MHRIINTMWICASILAGCSPNHPEPSPVPSTSPPDTITPTPAARTPTLPRLKRARVLTEEEYCHRKRDRQVTHVTSGDTLDLFSQKRPLLGLHTTEPLPHTHGGSQAPEHPTETDKQLDCGEGKESVFDRDTDTHICCMPDQQAQDGECVGEPTCEEGRTPVSGACLCEQGKHSMGDEAAPICCYPGQRAQENRCLGTPTHCPRGWQLKGDHCSKPAPAGMAYIPSGVFMMGPFSTDYQGAMSPVSTSRDDLIVERCFEPEEVDVQEFFIDMQEVSTAAYTRCVKAGHCTSPQRGAKQLNYGKRARLDHPINGVSFEQAKQYCRWRGKRLPTSTEWEKAARGVDGADFAWGDDPPDCARAVFHACTPQGTRPRGQHPTGVSPYGLHHTAGNVAEWVIHHVDMDEPIDILRGGDWTVEDGDYLRAHAMQGGGWEEDDDPTSLAHAGIRCARDSK